MKTARNKNLLKCFLLIGCLRNITTEYIFPALKPLSRYSYTVYENQKVDSNICMFEVYGDLKTCINICYNKEECKSLDAKRVDENTLKCRFFHFESPNITQDDGYKYISSKPPNCSQSCILTPNPCGKCVCNPSCAARNRRQHVCNCTLAAGVAKSCQEHYSNGFSKTGIYKICPNGSAFWTVCEMEKLEFQNPKNVIVDVNERALNNNNFIATLPLLEKTFSVFFKFKLTDYPKHHSRNLIHLTQNSDWENYGDRIPGVWILSTGCIMISFVVNQNKDYQFITNQIPLNSWLSIQITQTQINEVYSYRIYLNGTNVLNIVNTMPQSFENVKVYNTDPWYLSADGFIKDLKIVSGKVESRNFVYLDEHLLSKNHLIATLPCLEKIYSVSFKIKPLHFHPSDVFKSVIHLTIQGNMDNYGDRTPGLWFSPNLSGNLQITSAVSGNKNYYFYTKPLTLNVWYDIQIIQIQLNGIYNFVTYLNGEIVNIVENTKPQSFSNVKVFTANPWDLAHYGYIKDLRIINGFDFFDKADENELVKDNLIALLSSLEKTYSISFKLKPRSYSPGWKNVIHLTLDSLSSQYSDGVLAVSFYNDSSGRLFISSAVNGNNDYRFITQPLPLNVWSQIQISQVLVNGVYVFEINLNGITLHCVENRMPQRFQNVYVYSTNSWYDAQDGSIKDLQIIKRGCKVWTPMLTRFSSWESSFWNRSYDDYVNGFGLVNQQWIGLKNLNQLTNSFFTDMRVDYFLTEEIAFSTMYSNVVVGSSNDNYKFSYDEYDSKGSSEPDLFNANGNTFKMCSNWWTTNCDKVLSPVSTNYISYGSTENLYSIQFFLCTKEIKIK